MTNDLEQRVNDAINLLSPITIYSPSDLHTITGDQMDLLRELIKDQQAEINRLKSEKVRLRPMEELKALIEEDNNGYHDGSMVYAVFNTGRQAIVALSDANLRLGLVYYDINDFVGWTDLSDLPTEIEVTE